MSDTLSALLGANLAAAVAVALAMVLRRPVRRLFGPRVAYGLWLLVPLFAAAMLTPARVVTVWRPAVGPAQVAAHADAAFDASTLSLGLWLAGAVSALAWLVWRQAQFARAVRAGRAGPAVVGVLRPRIVVPDDFASRYTPREQTVVLAHEQTHIARHDSRINGLVALARCVGWFNPAAHLMASALRVDQEFACDADVVAAHPAARRSYAEAMLKTQLAGRPLPLGCYWPAAATHPLAERIALLSRRAPGPIGRRLGGALVLAIALGGAIGVWAARPPQIVLAVLPAPPRPQILLANPAAARPTRPAHIGKVAPASPPRPAPEPPVAMTPTPVDLPPAAEDPAPPVLTEATDDPALRPEARRLLPPGAFARPFRPPRVRALANWSSVEPGLAVRVLATMTDPDGVPLTTDLTAFGSQSAYRVGYVERNSSRYKLFTSVVQRGDQLHVTAALNPSFGPFVSGAVDLAPGETGSIRLPNGLEVTVTPTVRPETPEEAAEGRGPRRVDVFRIAQAS